MPTKKLTTVLVAALMLTTIGSLLPATSASASVADSVPNRTYVTNGPVETVVRSGDTIYIGGRFSRIGPRTGPGVELALDGTENAGLPEVTGGGGSVRVVIADGSGGWYIGGLFEYVGGVARNNIAHIRADRSVDPAFNPNANGGIQAMALSGATLYAAGVFTSIGGQTRNRIAGLSTENGNATAFDPGADATVEALAVSNSGSIIYAGGRFSVIGGLPRKNIAALNAADGTAVQTFNPTSDGIVLALAISGATLYVGGSFTLIGGQRRSNIAALNAGGTLDGTAVPTFDPSSASGTCTACGSVSALAVSASGSTVYAGGFFTIIGGQSRRYLAALGAADGRATAFNPNPNGNIIGLAVSPDDSTLYAAGGFNAYDGLPNIGGQVRNYLAAISTTDGTATGFNPNPNSAALAFGVTDSAVYAGGAFSSIGGVTRGGIAAINAADGTATSFNPNARFGANTANVYAIVVSGSTVYAGGYFTSIGGQPRNYIAALNAADGTATAWNPGANSIIETLALSGSILYAGGYFTSIGGQARNAIAALNLGDGSATAFNPSANSAVADIVVAGPLVYAAGYFTSIGGQTRNKVAALNASDGSATAWHPDATSNANILAIAVDGPTVYLGGNFATMGGVARKNIAAVNTSDGLVTDFDPQASDGVFALALSGTTVYAAGFFSTIGGQTRHLIAELDPDDGSATGFNPGGDPGFGAFALTVAPDGTLYAGGTFRTFDLAFQQGIVSFAGPPLNLAPIARLAATPTTGVAPLSVTLDASTSSDPDSGDTIASYTFDFGDGSAPLTQAGAATSHTYTASGTHAATVTVTDSRGLQSTNIASVPIQVSPSAPVIATPMPGAMLNASSVTITGTTEANLTVKISEGASLLETTLTDATGAFSVAHTFADGPHSITATATQGLGNTGAASAVRTFTVDTLAPSAPVIATPFEGATLTDSFVALSGTSEPAASVTLREGAWIVATVQADNSGAWSTAVGFTNGAHTITATTTDAAGNTGTSPTRAFTVTDTTAPAAPVITTPAESSSVDASLVVATGSAEAGANITLHQDDEVVGATTTNTAGTWRARLFGNPTGAQTITASATDPAGNASAKSTPRSFTVTANTTPSLAITSPGQNSIQPGTMTFTGTGAKPGHTIALNENGARLATLMPAADGTWTMNLSLPTGAHTVVATSTGLDASDPVTFTVDAEPPAIQITTTPRTIFLPGDTTRISGTADDNLSVTAITVTYFDAFNNQIAKQSATCTCTPGPQTVNWTANPTLPRGSYTAVAYSVDAVGNVSPTRMTSFIVI